MWKLYIGLFFFIGFFNSCEIVNPEEQVPAYLRIESFEVVTNAVSEGSNSNGITDVWVFVNDNLVGGYELPATIPVLHQGKVNIKLRAGIKNSGSANLRLEYPFYTNYELSGFELKPDSVYHINPVVTYYSNSLEFALIEDFEGTSYELNTSPESVPLFVTTNTSECLEGNGSLRVNVSDNQIFRAVSNNVYVLPKEGKTVYLEMDYLSQGYIEVRLISNNITGLPSETSVIVLYPTANKKKIYIDLAPIVSSNTAAASFSLVLMAYNQSGQTQSVNYMDNIKLIYYKN